MTGKTSWKASKQQSKMPALPVRPRERKEKAPDPKASFKLESLDVSSSKCWNRSCKTMLYADFQFASTAPESDDKEPMKEGDSNSEGDSCKHLALMRQGVIPCKVGCKGTDGKS
jgi:hypothetical protein